MSVVFHRFVVLGELVVVESVIAEWAENLVFTDRFAARLAPDSFH